MRPPSPNSDAHQAAVSDAGSASDGRLPGEPSAHGRRRVPVLARLARPFGLAAWLLACASAHTAPLISPTPPFSTFGDPFDPRAPEPDPTSELERAIRDAQARIAAGATDAGFAALAALSKRHPDSARPDQVAVALRLQRGEHAAALAAVAGLEAKRPRDALTHHLKGSAALGVGDFAAARRDFERAVALDPDHAPSLQQLARLDLQAGDVARARARFGDVLKRSPKDPTALVQQAAVLAASRAEPAAVRD
ncbi:MAG TPA: tetratricopeptide repeat protein, partial [Burkholderiaceae bacterium]|nr:tetratricopeptide repeat protein [Burkholderiaceae bacterium]